MTDQSDLLQRISDILVQDFEVPADAITPDAHLYTDLDLDSIDAVDLVIQIQELIHTKVRPEDFKSAQTLRDVLELIARLQGA